MGLHDSWNTCAWYEYCPCSLSVSLWICPWLGGAVFGSSIITGNTWARTVVSAKFHLSHWWLVGVGGCLPTFDCRIWALAGKKSSELLLLESVISQSFKHARTWLARYIYSCWTGAYKTLIETSLIKLITWLDCLPGNWFGVTIIVNESGSCFTETGLLCCRSAHWWDSLISVQRLY